MATDALLALPEAILLAAAVLIPLFGGQPGNRVRSQLTVLALSLSFLSVLWMLVDKVAATGLGFYDLFPLLENVVLLDAFEVTPFALFFKLTFLTVALFTAISSQELLAERRQSPEYYSLLLIATVGMMVVASARDLITLFVGLETAALSSYTLAGYRKRLLGPAEASTKFFIVGALSAALTLYGISLVYTLAGTVDIYRLASLVAADPTSQPALLLASAFLIAGFGFKITSVPFHMWAPDVYQGAPDTISAFLSGASKKMGFAAFFKVFFVALVAAKLQWGPLVGFLAILTMLAGNLAALQQTNLKRMLAWSSVAQAGYIMIAIPVGTELALTGALFHIFTHALMKGGAFLLVAYLVMRGVPDDIASYRGLARRQPLAAATLSILLLSMAGIPPLAGFASKFVLFRGVIAAGIENDNLGFITLVVVALIGSAISVVYYARVVWAVYVQEPEGQVQRIPLSPTASGVLMMFLLLVVLFGVLPGPMIDLSQVAAASLLESAGAFLAPPVVPGS